MSVLRHDRSTGIVRIAPTWQDIKSCTNLLTLFDVTSIEQGTKGLQGSSWYSFYSGDALIGTHSDITEVEEK